MTPPHLVRFGVFELDVKTGELRKRGVTVKLQEQPFRVLATLVERAGDLVTRDELREHLWPTDVFVDFEHNLNKAVMKVRSALGDLADSPRYIETLERRGYRFIAPVEIIDETAASRDSGIEATSPCRLVYAGRTVWLHDGPNVIGRDPDAAVFIDSPKVSRRHALVTVNTGSATLSDLGSKNGTFVNTEPVHSPIVLADGDEVVVGSARLVYRNTPVAASTESDLGD